MKKTILAAIVLAAFVSVNADARGARGFSGGRSFSSRSYRAPALKPRPRSAVTPKSTPSPTNKNRSSNENDESNGSGFWSGVFGAAAGSMAGNVVYDALTEDEKDASETDQVEPEQPSSKQ